MYQRSGSSEPQDRAKPPMRQHGKADAGKAEGRRAEDAGQAEAEGEVADEQLKQRADAEIGGDQQAGGGADQHGVAAERHLEDAVDDAEPTTIISRKMPK